MTGPDERDPLAGVPAELLDWHEGALAGDPAVCGAAQPGRPGFPCVWNRSSHSEHRDVFGREWPAVEGQDEPLFVARRGGALPEDVTALLRAVHEALDIPHPATVGDSEVHDRILNDRVMHAVIALRSVLDDERPSLGIEWTTEYLRARLAEHPPTGYRSWLPSGGEQDGGGS